MNLKSKKPLEESLSNLPQLPQPDPSKGPWGKINPHSNPSGVTRFCQCNGKKMQTHSYAYRVLSSWHWTGHPDLDLLVIHAGGDTITVKGKCLERLVEALDQWRLEWISETESHVQVGQEAVCSISSIAIETD